MGGGKITELFLFSSRYCLLKSDNIFKSHGPSEEFMDDHLSGLVFGTVCLPVI